MSGPRAVPSGAGVKNPSVRHGTTSIGTPIIRFLDAHKVSCNIQLYKTARETLLFMGISTPGGKPRLIALDRGLVAALLPALVRFAEDGELSEQQELSLAGVSIPRATRRGAGAESRGALSALETED